MKDKVSIALDVDGVLADFYKALCEKYNKPMISISSWSQEWINEVIHEVYRDEDFWATLPLLSKPEDINFDFDFYLTHLPEHLHDVREFWLHMNGFPSRELICENTLRPKSVVCKKRGINVLIDDSPKQISSCISNGIVGIQFLPHYYNADFPIKSSKTVRHINHVGEILKGTSNLQAYEFNE